MSSRSIVPVLWRVHQFFGSDNPCYDPFHMYIYIYCFFSCLPSQRNYGLFLLRVVSLQLQQRRYLAWRLFKPGCDLHGTYGQWHLAWGVSNRDPPVGHLASGVSTGQEKWPVSMVTCLKLLAVLPEGNYGILVVPVGVVGDLAGCSFSILCPPCNKNTKQKTRQINTQQTKMV